MMMRRCTTVGDTQTCLAASSARSVKWAHGGGNSWRLMLDLDAQFMPQLQCQKRNLRRWQGIKGVLTQRDRGRDSLG